MPDASPASGPSPNGSKAGQTGPPRKRNVTSRDRNGCITCRKRHLRCDKTHPECNNCLKMNRVCEGYIVNRIAFCDETLLTTEKAKGKIPKRARGRVAKRVVVDATVNTTAKEIAAERSLRNLEEPQPDTTDLVPGAMIPVSEAGDWMLPEWALSLWPQDDQAQPIEDASPVSLIDMNPVTSNALIDMTALDIYSPSLAPSPSALQPMAVRSEKQPQFFCTPQDTDYIQRLRNGGIDGLTTILPIQDLIVDQGVMAPHCWSAAIAVSALTFSKQGFVSTQNSRYHAIQHYRNAVHSVKRTFPQESPGAFQNVSPGDLLGWFLTRLLLANFDLCRGNLSSWRHHLRIAGRIFSSWHQRILVDSRGRQLAHAFARMALLVELQNGDLALTRVQDMNPGVASQLNTMMEQSESSRDRLLALIRNVSKLEIKFRYQPEKHEKWTQKLELIDAKLAEWQQNLPSSELPVDTGVADAVKFPVSLGSSMPSLEVTPLTFPNSSNPYTCAVNYAHFLCARMRVRTRYLPNGGKINPPETESTVLYTCRIAAGLSPLGCARANAFGHGMMPALVGAYRWSNNPQARHWIISWLKGYEEEGGREGLWNVQQTRRLLSFLDDEARRRKSMSGCWDIIAARIEDEDDSSDKDSMSSDGSATDASFPTQGDLDWSFSPCMALNPFRVVVHSRSPDGWATDHYVVT
ncbi:hypothetical protein B0J13DRAFT_69453 [Dactylonectria estremocensis]|uniref:Zn(2)-C6 fungal-type domain-containing protein n=1 Tax=Dactylonectria estremocensis TaxID=1079267 RepID=A0A9P9IZT5_9HYPO|nr:hypothetical protein B0J13DRAFT_69453 [Dactylonectria estremocensis]